MTVAEWVQFLEEEHKITSEVWRRHGVSFDDKKLAIPYYDAEGKLLFSKTRMPPTYIGGNKYLYPTGAKITLYPLDNLKENKELILCEGELDVLTLESFGFPAITSGGVTSFKKEFIPLLKEKKITVCFDTDSAGLDGTNKVSQMLAAGGVNTYVMSLPQMEDGKDIGDYFKNGHAAEEFATLLKTAIPVKAAEQSEEADEEETTTKKGSKAEVTFSANFPDLIDLVQVEGKTAYMIRDLSGEVKITNIYKFGSKTLVPPPMDKLPYTLPRANEVLKYLENHKEADCEADAMLYQKLLDYHKNISDLPDELYYDLLVLWDFHSYFLEKANYSPILSFFADADKGKSRTCKGLIFVAKRGVRVETVSDAHIIRMAQDLGASIFFDCMDLWKEVERAGSRDVLLNRFERGMKVPRVLYPDKGAFKDTVYYDIFGPTLIATNEPIHQILETRAIPIIMQASPKRFDKEVTPESSLELKEQLVAWRAAHFDDIPPEVNKLVNFRMGDILRPLHQIIKMVNPEREKVFLQLVKKLEEERLGEKAETLEAEIIYTMGILKDMRNSSGIPYLQHGKIAIKDITDSLNNKRTEREKLTYQLVGRRIKALGFKKGTTSDRNSAAAVYWDLTKFDQLKKTYGLAGKTSEMSGCPGDMYAQAGVTEVSDVSQNLPIFKVKTVEANITQEEYDLLFSDSLFPKEERDLFDNLPKKAPGEYTNDEVLGVRQLLSDFEILPGMSEKFLTVFERLKKGLDAELSKRKLDSDLPTSKP